MHLGIALARDRVIIHELARDVVEAVALRARPVLLLADLAVDDRRQLVEQLDERLHGRAGRAVLLALVGDLARVEEARRIPERPDCQQQLVPGEAGQEGSRLCRRLRVPALRDHLDDLGCVERVAGRAQQIEKCHDPPSCEGEAAGYGAVATGARGRGCGA